MKTKTPNFVKMMEEIENIASLKKEDIDRIRRHEDGYGDDLEESLKFPSLMDVAESALKESSDDTEDTVRALKKNSEVDNPWALANWLKTQGYEPGTVK